MAKVKNPNYNPLDPNSKRFITVPEAVQEADNKALTMNDLFKPFADLAKPFTPQQFFNPERIQLPADGTRPAPSRQTLPADGSKPAPTPQELAAGAEVENTKQLAANTAVGGDTRTPTSANTYTIQAGDTLGAIARRLNTTVEALAAAIGIQDPNRTNAGQTLQLPSGATPPPAPTAGGTANQNVQGQPTGQPQAGAQGGATPTGDAAIEVPKTGEPTTDKALQDLAKKAGEAGLSLDQYLDVVRGQATPSAEESEEIRNNLGIPDLVDDVFSKPEKKTVEIYRELYDLAGLGEVKSQIKEINDRISQKRDDLVKATGDLNNNPWISQGTRAGRLKNLQELAFADINNDIAEKEQLLDLYDQGLDEIEKEIGFIAADTELDRAIDTDKLNFLLSEAEREEELVERRTISRGLRNVPDFIEGTLDREETEFNRDLIKSGRLTTGSGSGGGDISQLSVTAQAVAQNPSLLDRYTPTRQGEILDELAGAGVDVSTFTLRNLSGTERGKVADFDDLVGEAQLALTILEDEDLNTGFLSSRIKKGQALFGGAETFTRYRSSIDNIQSALLKLRSGAAVTPQEYERLKGFIPNVNDDEDTAKTKITRLKEELAEAQANFIERQSQNVQDLRSSVGLDSEVSEDVKTYVDGLDLNELDQ